MFFLHFRRRFGSRRLSFANIPNFVCVYFFVGPSRSPSVQPTMKPTDPPTDIPTNDPTHSPTMSPTQTPTRKPSSHPTRQPSMRPTTTFIISPETNQPTSLYEPKTSLHVTQNLNASVTNNTQQNINSSSKGAFAEFVNTNFTLLVIIASIAAVSIVFCLAWCVYRYKLPCCQQKMSDNGSNSSIEKEVTATENNMHLKNSNSMKTENEAVMSTKYSLVTVQNVIDDSTAEIAGINLSPPSIKKPNNQSKVIIRKSGKPWKAGNDEGQVSPKGTICLSDDVFASSIDF